MPATFDPLCCAGGPECVQALREMGIRISQRLGVRLHSLGAKGIQFSLALLEEAAPASPIEAFVLAEGWRELPPSPSQEQVLDLIRDLSSSGGASIADRLAVIPEKGVLKIVSSEEAGKIPPQEVAQPSGSLLPVVLGDSLQESLFRTFWDRARLEEAALVFLNAEDTTEIVENFRHLFRVALSCGQDVVPLLASALAREKPALSREAAALVKENLDRNLGRALEDLFSDDPMRLKGSLRLFLERREPLWDQVLRAIILPALTSLLRNRQNVSVLLSELASVWPYLEWNQAGVEPFLEALLGHLSVLESHERAQVANFLVSLQSCYPRASDFLLLRLQGTVDPHLRAFYGNVLSRMTLPEEVQRIVARSMVETFLTSGQDPSLQEKLKIPILNLAGYTLPDLCAPKTRQQMTMEQRIYLISLWNTVLATDRCEDFSHHFVELALAELISRSRATVLFMARLGLLAHPSLLKTLREKEALIPAAVQSLIDFALVFEEPDDEPVFRLLSRLGPAALDNLYESLNEEAALRAKSAPYLFRVFASVARDADLDAEGRKMLALKLEKILQMPFIREPSVSATLEGLGSLGASLKLPEETLQGILERLFADLEKDTESRLRAILKIYLARAASGSIRYFIEEKFIDVLAQDEPDRKVLSSILQTFEDMLGSQEPPLLLDRIATLLARKVLEKSRESPMDVLLKQALSPKGEGDGLILPSPWGKEDREQALRILGKMAGHPGIPQKMRRMIFARLFSLLEDWLEAQEHAESLYQYRDTPLWSILEGLLEESPCEEALQWAQSTGLRVMEIHRKAPRLLRLDQRIDIQRFLARVLVCSKDQPVEIRGIPIKIRRSLLQLLMEVGAQGVPATTEILEKVAKMKVLSQHLQAQLEAFLAYQKKGA